jgi:hypothetical protein
VNKFLLSGLIAISQLSACVTLQPVIPKETTPNAASGYVAGSFSVSSGPGFAFGLLNTTSGQELVIPFKGTAKEGRKDEVGMIAVPPGDYKVSYWVTYATLTNEQIKKSAVTNSVLAEPFKVAPGAVVHLGTFTANTTYAGSWVHWTIQPVRTTEADAKKQFIDTYPKFSEAAFSCRLCSP